MKKIFALLSMLALALAGLTFASTANAAGPTLPLPARGVKWQWQLSSTPSNAQILSEYNAGVRVWDVDGFNTPKTTVDYIRSIGGYPIAYFSAGTYEPGRPDSAKFTAAVKGAPVDGWPGEFWLDTRDWPSVRTIMIERSKLAASKGFAAIEWDNVDAYTNNPGFPLTYATQLDYNIFLSTASGIGGALRPVLKNDVDQIADLSQYFTIYLNEECYTYNECNVYDSVPATRPVFIAEYKALQSSWCTNATTHGYSLMRKNLDLDAPRTLCGAAKAPVKKKRR